jgi:ABC-type transport system involved in cytochrome c biogenesis permease subunit
VNTFFNPAMGCYTLGPYVRQYYQGNRDKFHQDVGKIDDKLQLIMELRQGKLLKVFPYTQHATTWYSPVDRYSDSISTEQQEYMRNVFSLLNEEAHAGRFDRMNEYLRKMQKYQAFYGGQSLPTTLQTKAERLYNRVPFATILFMVNLSMALLLLGMDMIPRKRTTLTPRFPLLVPRIILTLSFLALTLCLALRWIISGTIPMSNGYETMLVMAWMVMLVSLLMARRMSIMLTFGFLLSGIFLLVSHISQMDPQISHIMPVLSSPLLTLHVSIIMMAYALLSLTFMCGVVGLLTNLTPRSPFLAPRLFNLSRLFLYPALACLCFGIFLGAVWANVSWGTYWSWDPKETWALITLMVYAIAVHDRSIPWLREPRHYHLFMVLAYLTLLMTYFGVNYFLGGMHSYA